MYFVHAVKNIFTYAYHLLWQYSTTINCSLILLIVVKTLRTLTFADRFVTGKHCKLLVNWEWSTKVIVTEQITVAATDFYTFSSRDVKCYMAYSVVMSFSIFLTLFVDKDFNNTCIHANSSIPRNNCWFWSPRS